MVDYNTVNAKLLNSQMNQLKSAVKNNKVTTLRMNAKMFILDNLPHELLLTTRQATKLRNTIENNMSTDIIKNESKEQKVGFLSMLLGTLSASLLGDLLTKNLSGKGTVRAGAGTVKAGEGIKKKALILPKPHPFEIQDYYKNEPRFNGAFSRDNLPKTIKKWSTCNKP